MLITTSPSPMSSQACALSGLLEWSNISVASCLHIITGHNLERTFKCSECNDNIVSVVSEQSPILYWFERS